MRKLLILSVLSLITAASAGCFHRNTACGGLFGSTWAQPQPAMVQYANPCCQPVQCCPQPVPCCP
jgi:hypothetical protein